MFVLFIDFEYSECGTQKVAHNGHALGTLTLSVITSQCLSKSKNVVLVYINRTEAEMSICIHWLDGRLNLFFLLHSA